MNPTPAPPQDTALRGNLGAGAILFMVMATAAPLTVVGSTIPSGILLGNGEGFPAMFVVSVVILLLFSVGLMAMSKHLPDAGAFFTYVGHGLGPVAGTAAAYMAIVTYSTIQVGVFAFLGETVRADLVLLGGPSLPWWAYTLAGIAFVAALGYRHIELSSKVLVFVLIAEVGIVLVLAAVIVLKGGAQGLTGGSFTPQHIVAGAPALGLLFAIASFIGFESTVVYRSEVRDPDRTIPLATYGSAIIIGIFYTLSGVAVVWGIGASNLTQYIGADPTTVLARLTAAYLGPVGSVAVSVLFISSMFASVLALHNVLARYQHSMAIAGLLPATLAAVHPRHGSPHVSSLWQIATAVVVTVAMVAFGVPATSVFGWLVGIGTLAIALLMAATCVAVIVFFARHRPETNPLRTVVAPGLALIGLLASAWLIVTNFPLLVGDVDANGAPVWGIVSELLVAVVAAAAIVGAVQALVLRARHPAAYRRITHRIDSDSKHPSPTAQEAT